MDYFDAINSHRYLYLRSISEPEENSLRLEIAEAVADRPAEDRETAGAVFTAVQPIETVAGCSVYSIVFDSYIAYVVTNESYAQNATEDRYEGTLARIYTESAFLALVEKSTFATSDYPGPFKHYGFCCLNHIVDVASCKPPPITRAIAS
jgi:hypothetical protein